MAEYKDFVNDYFKTIYSSKGTDGIKEKFKQIVENTKNPRHGLSNAIKVPILHKEHDPVEYYESLSKVKSDIKYFKSRLFIIENLQQKILSASTPEESKENIILLNTTIKAFDKTAKSIFEVLKELGVSNSKLSKGNENSTEVKERIKQHSFAAKAFLEATSEFRRIQSNYSAKFKERIRRHVQISNPCATEKEIDTICKSLDTVNPQGDPISAIITHEALNNELKKAKEQNKEILELEQNINDLYNLFSEMSTMLVVQNETIANSQQLMQKAGRNTTVGIKEIQTGVKYHKRSKKKIMYLTVAAATFIFIVLVLALLKLQV